mmetsp:Transcript_102845/g.187769  ORF Transcript_102845/g.187769 Transcript_102845/m.187769 type:complete len:549 (-) Transcript_102845:12-1658(-)
MGQTVRELKAELTARGIDFSHCREKAELQQLLRDSDEAPPDASAGPAPDAPHCNTGATQAAGSDMEASSSSAAADAGEAAGMSSTATTGQAEEPEVASSGAAAPVASAASSSLSVRDMKRQLTDRGIDFSHCREKSELQDLLDKALAGKLGTCSDDSQGHPLDESFACRQSDGRRGWVEFVDGDDALCHWDDGKDGIVPAGELQPLTEAELRTFAFDGSFEEARAAAFHSGRLLIAAVYSGSGDRLASSKSECVQVLTLASEEVATLIEENAVMWCGRLAELRAPHQQQLAPAGTPSLAMVLPLAVDAMRVVSQFPGSSKDLIVENFVSALEAHEAHREAAEARQFSEDALLRLEQEEEFAAALAADQAVQAQATADTTAINEAQQQGAVTGASRHEHNDDQERSGCQDTSASHDASCEVAKRPAVESEANQDAERRAKLRKVLAEGFLSAPSLPANSATARLVLRLPNGERVERTFGADEPLSQVQKWAECCPLLPEARDRILEIPAEFELSTAFPRQTFGPEASDKSLAELGLVPNAALLLIDRSA